MLSSELNYYFSIERTKLRTMLGVDEETGEYNDMPYLLAKTSFWFNEDAEEILGNKLTDDEKENFCLYCFHRCTENEQESLLWSSLLYSPQAKERQVLPLNKTERAVINPAAVLAELLNMFPQFDNEVRTLISEKYLHKDLSKHEDFKLKLFGADCEQDVEFEFVWSFGHICEMVAIDNKNAKSFEFAGYFVERDGSGYFHLIDISLSGSELISYNKNLEHLLEEHCDELRVIEWWADNYGN